jgi:hypothetical protein
MIMRAHVVALCAAAASLGLLLSACGNVDDDGEDLPPAADADPAVDVGEAASALDPIRWCDSGPAKGQLCSSWHDCAKYCNAGPSYNQVCATSADCQKICSDGPSKGAACSVAADCGRYCIGNLSTLRQPCSANAECGAGGLCVLSSCGGVGCAQPGCSGVGG